MNYPWGEHIWDHQNPLQLSYSSRGTLHNCARKFEFYRFFKNPRKIPQMEGEVGQAMHEAWQEFLITKDLDAAVWKLMRSYPIRLNYDVSEGRSLEACYATLVKLVNNINLVEYTLATIRHIDGTELPAVEVEFEIWIDGVTIDGRPVVYVGYIDAIFFNILTGEYLVVDLKTHRRNNLSIPGEYMHNEQCVPYGVVLQQCLGQSINKFNVMYLPTYIDIREPEIQVYNLEKNAEQVNDWFQGLFIDIQNIKTYREADFFPRTGYGCASWGKDCQYLSICKSRDKNMIQTMLSADPEDIYPERVRAPWVRFVMKYPERKQG